MKSFFSFLLSALKRIIFYPMLFFRGPFLLVSNFIIGLGTIGFLIILFLNAAPASIKVIFFCVPFFTFLLSYFYDVLLLRLNLDNVELTLNRWCHLVVIPPLLGELPAQACPWSFAKHRGMSKHDKTPFWTRNSHIEQAVSATIKIAPILMICTIHAWKNYKITLSRHLIQWSVSFSLER